MATVEQARSVVEDWLQMDHRFSQAVLDALPAHVAVLDSEGTIVAVNRAWTQFAAENGDATHRMSGVGVNYRDVARQATGPYSDEARAAYAGIMAVLDGSVPQFALEYPCHSATQQRWFQMHVTLVHDLSSPTAVVMHHDVSERKRAEEALQARERRFRAMIENSSDGISLLAADGTILLTTPCGTRLTGYAVGENHGKPIWELVHPEDIAALRAQFSVVLRNQEACAPVSFRYRHKDGSWHWLEAVAANLLADPAVQGIVINCRDISERKQADEVLRESEERYRSLVESSQDTTLILENDCIRYCNPAGLTLLGAPSLEALLGRPIGPFFHPEDQELGAARRRSIRETGQPVPPHPLRVLRLDGQQIVVESHDTLCLHKGKPVIQAVFRDITARAQAETALLQSERRLHNILDSMFAFVGLFSTDGILLETNQASLKAANLRPEDVIGKPFADTYWCAHTEAAQEQVRQAIRRAAQGETVREDFSVRIGPDRLLTVDGVMSPLRGSTDEIVQVVGSCVDITERKRAEAQLSRRLRQQEAVAEFGMFAFKATDLDKVLNKCVATVSHVLGDELCKVLELQPDGHSLLLRAGVGWNEGLVGRAVVGTERESQAGYTLLTDEPVNVADLGTETRFSGPPLLRDHGVVSGLSVVISGSERPFGVLGTHTRQRRDYSKDDAFFLQSVANILADFIKRQKIEARYRLLVQSVEDYAIVMLDPAGIVTTWNSGAERITSYKAEEVIGQSVSMFYLPDDVATGKPFQELEQAAKEGRIAHEGWRLAKGGSRLLAECVTFALKDDAGKLLGFSRVLRDTTSQRREEGALRSAMDHSVDAIVTIDQQGVIQSCAGAAQKIFGYTRSELVGNNVNMLMPDPWRSEHDGYLSNYLRTGVAKVIGNVREVTGLRKDGSTVPLELVITEFRIDGGRFFTGILRDLTERKKLEEQLRQSQKMEAIGQLAGGIAHDFNNLLTVITGYSEMVMTSLPANDPHKGLIAEVVKAGDRAASLTNQLLAFSRKQILAPKVLNINDVVEDCERMLRHMIGEDVVLATAYDPALHRVKVDPGQIEQVVMNLAVNARDAMPQGGTLTMATCNMDLDEEQCRQYPGRKPGNYAAITMTDTGCGMTPEVKARIFEPFYTTKGVGKGTGLGLATVYGIVKQSEGYIAVDSTVGAGTTFTVLLPSAMERTASSPAQHGQKRMQRGSEIVLLVEDEDAVRKLARLILEMNGYTVLEASNGRQAINLEKTHAGPIHLLITDVVMPEMGGRQLVALILPRHPGLKVLYTSGYTDDAVVQHGVSDSTEAFLQKPFSLPSLAKKVREVLDGKI